MAQIFVALIESGKRQQVKRFSRRRPYGTEGKWIDALFPTLKRRASNRCARGAGGLRGQAAWDARHDFVLG